MPTHSSEVLHLNTTMIPFFFILSNIVVSAGSKSMQLRYKGQLRYKLGRKGLPSWWKVHGFYPHNISNLQLLPGNTLPFLTLQHINRSAIDCYIILETLLHYEIHKIMRLSKLNIKVILKQRSSKDKRKQKGKHYRPSPQKPPW